MHRCIHKQTQGYQAFTEYALANGRAPVSRQALFERLGRHCDAVLIRGQHLYLAETESAPKATEALMRICAMAEHVGRRVHPELPLVFAGVFIVFDAEQNRGPLASASHADWRYLVRPRRFVSARAQLRG